MVLDKTENIQPDRVAVVECPGADTRHLSHLVHSVHDNVTLESSGESAMLE